MAKFKALKTFISSIGSYEADQEYDEKLDKYTLKNWSETGLIEQVKVGDSNEGQ